MKAIDTYLKNLDEPLLEVHLFLQQFYFSLNNNITLEYKWNLPYFYYKGKPLCYVWKDAKTQTPYIGFAKGYLINHPALIAGNRNTIKIYPIPFNNDINLTELTEISLLALALYP